MKWVLITPEIEIQPRDSSSTIIAYVVRSRPIPPYPSGIVTPNRPSSFICSTTASGNLSSWSNSSATGMISLSTNPRTISVIAFCSSVFSAYVGVATAIAGDEQDTEDVPSENVELAGRIAQAMAPGDFVTLLEDEEQLLAAASAVEP